MSIHALCNHKSPESSSLQILRDSNGHATFQLTGEMSIIRLTSETPLYSSGMPMWSMKVSRDQYAYHSKEKAMKPPTRLSPDFQTA